MTANLLSLPNELIIEVLSYLPYWDLKSRVSLVNKHFNGILHSHNSHNNTGTGSLACALFRDYLAQSANENGSYQIHPVLSAENLWRISSGSWIYGNQASIHITEQPFANENAVSPAVTQLIIRQEWGQRDWPHFHVFGATPGAAVTIMDVLNGIDDIFKIDTAGAIGKCAVIAKHEDGWNDWMERRRGLAFVGWSWAGAEIFGVYRGVLNLVVDIDTGRR